MTIAMERDYRLLWMYFDRYGRMQPAAMLEIFQDLAISHAEELGIGRSAMLEKNVVWVVIRTKLEVLREPKYNTIVTRGRIRFQSSHSSETSRYATSRETFW